MFKSYKEFKNNRKKYKGFTLIELLAILLILFLIFTIVIYSFTDVFKSTKETISKVDENIILSAANDYALEYRGKDTWVEDVDVEGNVSFCVSLQSLIDYGYFKDDGSNFEKYKDDYVVEFHIKNGVSSYKFMARSESDVCSTREFSSSISNSNINTEVKDQNGNSIGEFNYEVNKINDKKYSFGFDVSLDLINMIKDEEVYVTFILDRSSSMEENDKYKYATEATIDFSNKLVNSDKIDAKVALILFDDKSEITSKKNGKKGFIDNAFSRDFFSRTGSGTNLGAGLDMAISLMCHSGLDIDPSDSQWCTNISDVPIDNTKSKKLYTILFFDGTSNDVCGIDPNDMWLEVHHTIDDVTKREIYYRHFMTTVQYDWESEDFNNYVSPGINYLKNELDVNLFMIGYEFIGEFGLEKYATEDDKLCFDGYNLDGKKYCYYDASTGTVDKVLNNILNNIVNDAGVSSLKFTFSSVKSKDGNDFITILNPDDSEVENNKLEIKFDELDSFNGNLIDHLEGYKFMINDSVYDFCSNEEEECKLDDAKLFNVILDIEYVDGKDSFSLGSPNFDLKFTELKTIN